MHLFYCQNLESSIAELSKEESLHASSVLRVRIDEVVMVTDGRGTMCQARVTSNSKTHTTLLVTSREQEYCRRDFTTHIALAPTKSIDRYEWFLEKATEINIDHITPLLTSNSERRVVKRERSQKVILSAVKQSQKAYLPELDELTPFKKFLTTVPDGACKFIAHCDEESSKLELKHAIEPHQDYIILIGPEGDFTREEVSLAHSHGFRSVSLGSARLRTETAALYAVTLIAIANTD